MTMSGTVGSPASRTRLTSMVRRGSSATADERSAGQRGRESKAQDQAERSQASETSHAAGSPPRADHSDASSAGTGAERTSGPAPLPLSRGTTTRAACSAMRPGSRTRPAGERDPGRPSVRAVAEQGGAGVGGVDADLVGASGDRRQRQQRDPSRRDGRDGVPRAGRDRVATFHHAQPRVASATDGRVPESALRSRRALRERNVPALVASLARAPSSAARPPLSRGRIRRRPRRRGRGARWGARARARGPEPERRGRGGSARRRHGRGSSGCRRACRPRRGPLPSPGRSRSRSLPGAHGVAPRRARRPAARARRPCARACARGTHAPREPRPRRPPRVRAPRGRSSRHPDGRSSASG